MSAERDTRSASASRRFLAERDSRGSAILLDRPLGERARAIAGETHRLWDEQRNRPVHMQPILGRSVDPVLRGLEDELHHESAMNSFVHDQKMSEIQRIKEELRECILRDQMEEQEKAHIKVEIDRVRQVHDVQVREVEINNSEIQRHERNSRLDGIRARWDMNSEKSKIDAETRAQQFCHELEVSADARHRTMHLRMLEAEQEATHRAMACEQMNLEMEEQARMQAAALDKERVDYERQLVEQENQARKQHNDQQAREYNRLVDSEHQRAERLEASFEQLQRERDELAQIANAEAQRAAEAEADRQRLSAEYQQLQHSQNQLQLESSHQVQIGQEHLAQEREQQRRVAQEQQRRMQEEDQRFAELRNEERQRLEKQRQEMMMQEHALQHKASTIQQDLTAQISAVQSSIAAHQHQSPSKQLSPSVHHTPRISVTPSTHPTPRDSLSARERSADRIGHPPPQMHHPAEWIGSMGPAPQMRFSADRIGHEPPHPLMGDRRPLPVPAHPLVVESQIGALPFGGPAFPYRVPRSTSPILSARIDNTLDFAAAAPGAHPYSYGRSRSPLARARSPPTRREELMRNEVEFRSQFQRFDRE